jgi:hypothetical protein
LEGKKIKKEQKNRNRTQKKKMGRPSLGRPVRKSYYLPQRVGKRVFPAMWARKISGLALPGHNERGPYTKIVFLF